MLKNCFFMFNLRFLALINSNNYTMKKKFNGFLTLLLAFVVQITFAQEKTISGTVTEESGALPGVSVLIKGTKTGTETDFNGKYSIKAKTGDVLIFRYIGYKTAEMKITSSNTIDVSLKSDDNTLDEVIIVAFGNSTRESFTGSANVVGASELALRNVTNPLLAIEGKATGVQFTSPSGQPGSSPGIVIRGVGTLNGNASPLYVVDGIQFEGSINTINQEDIESFTILKDAASTSLYGSRAANGVVLITTKKGKIGATKTNFSLQSGFVRQGIANYDEVSPGQYYETMWESLRNSTAGGGNAAFASANIYNSLGYNPFNVPNNEIVGLDGKLNPNATLLFKSLNWYDVLNRTGFRKNFNVNISGGNEKNKTFFSASYLDEEGYIIKSDFNRLTTRFNSDYQVNKWLKIGGSLNLSLAQSQGPSSAGTGSIVNPFGFAKNIGSIYPVYLNDLQGNLVLDAAGNPIFDNGEGYPQYNISQRPISQGRHALQELLLNDDRTKNNTYGFRFYSDIKLMEGLNLTLNYGRDINEGFSKQYENNIIGDAQPTGRYRETRSRREVENFNQILTYSTSIKNIHNIDITAGHESFARSFTSMNGLAIQQTAEGIFEFDNFATPVSLGGSTTNKRVEGYFLRTNYNFDNKYYISGSIRRDASSVFDAKSRWGNFFSVGAAWRIDQEKFMDNVKSISKLKLRASYGEVGNDDLGDFFLSQPRYGITSNAGNPALIWSTIGNADLQWETVGSFDVALEFGLFNGLIDGSIEYYKRNSTDLLYDLPIALSNGLNSFPANVADMFNSGWEFSLTGNLLTKNDFKWSLTLQASTFKNQITSIPDPFINGSKRWEIGRSRYDFFLLHTAGVDPNNGDQLFKMFEIDADGNSVPVLDVNGQQELTNDWTTTERAYTGDSSIPDLLGSISNSFSYKGLDLNILITYGIGGKTLDNGYSAMMHSGNFGNSYHPDILKAWRQPGDITDVPRLQSQNPNLVRTQSTRFLTDASFWSLRNVSLGYSINNESSKKLGVDNIRVSITGENLFLKSKRTGLDPQFSLGGTPAGNAFNPSKIFSFGLNVSL